MQKVGREGIFKPIIGNDSLHEQGQSSESCNFEKSNC
jgi:hypothetical protein